MTVRSETREVEGVDVRFFDPGMGRWVFAGSLTPSGYLTIEDAAEEAGCQLRGEAQGPLADRAGHDVPITRHRETWRRLGNLASRY